MKIISWNVAGLRAMIKKNNLLELLTDDEYNTDYDIICLQETKCEENEIQLPKYIEDKYLYRYWNSTKGITQRKGLSGTTIWSIKEPINITNPDFDNEGRILVLEFEKYYIINVYIPNSQKYENHRYYFREKWDKEFYNYIKELKNSEKEIIVCGDFNVAHMDIDINNPKQKKNKIPGFFDFEINNFEKLLNDLNLLDIFRELNPDKQESTYWSYLLKKPRSNTNGWRIDYFIITENLKKDIKNCIIMNNIFGSDHCPLILDINM